MNNTPDKNELEQNFLDKNQQNNSTPQGQGNTSQPIVWDEFEYKQFGNAPKITLSGLSMCILAPLLVVIHILLARFMRIPRIQYGFVTFLVAFIVNYTAIIRKYQLRPYLAQPVYDNKLKYLCILAIVGMVMTLTWGWNGSSGMIFACYWEYSRGNRMGVFGYIFLLIGVGSLLMEQYFGWQKALQFIPGLIFGYIASVLFTMRQSPTYTIAHQYIFLTAMVLPMFFPASILIVPNVFQWLFMIATGLSLLFTIVLLVKLMQLERVSIVVASISGIVLVGTSRYTGGFIDFVGAFMIITGLVWMIKKEYIDANF